MDWVTGEVVELDSTRANSPQDPAADPHPDDPLCADALGDNEAPRWSPDGARLLFTRSDMRTPDGSSCVDGLLTFVVDDDGGNLRELVPLELFARDAQWSPDGARIVFTSAVFGTTEEHLYLQLNDIYTVRPDGTELTRLTRYSEEPIEWGAIGALRPSWTHDGRIVFVRIPRGDPNVPHGQVWIMDADGRNARALVPADASTFTGIGCVTCPYPPDELADGPSEGNAIWLP
jgi:Tol biopolymer transport system component